MPRTREDDVVAHPVSAIAGNTAIHRDISQPPFTSASRPNRSSLGGASVSLDISEQTGVDFTTWVPRWARYDREIKVPLSKM